MNCYTVSYNLILLIFMNWSSAIDLEYNFADHYEPPHSELQYDFADQYELVHSY